MNYKKIKKLEKELKKQIKRHNQLINEHKKNFNKITEKLQKIRRKYEKQAKERQDKGSHWTNLRNCAYLQEFEQEKIIWKRIGSKLRFSYSNKNEFTLDSTVIATGKKLKYLIALLNSKLHTRELLLNAPKTGTGDVIVSVQALNPLMVYNPTDEEAKPFITKVEKIITEKAFGNDTSRLESDLDEMIYELYGLNEEEKVLIRQS